MHFVARALREATFFFFAFLCVSEHFKSIEIHALIFFENFRLRKATKDAKREAPGSKATENASAKHKARGCKATKNASAKPKGAKRKAGGSVATE